MRRLIFALTLLTVALVGVTTAGASAIDIQGDNAIISRSYDSALALWDVPSAGTHHFNYDGSGSFADPQNYNDVDDFDYPDGVKSFFISLDDDPSLLYLNGDYHLLPSKSSASVIPVTVENTLTVGPAGSFPVSLDGTSTVVGQVDISSIFDNNTAVIYLGFLAVVLGMVSAYVLRGRK